MSILKRLRQTLAEKAGVHVGLQVKVRGFAVMIENTRPDIETSAVLARLDEALALIERHQPWRFAHLRRDLAGFTVVRFP